MTYLEKFVELQGRTARIRRNVGNGWEIVEVRLPVLVTVLDSAAEPRPPAARRVMKFKRAQVRAEIAAAVQAALPNATDAQKEEEVERRAEHVRCRGLMLEQWGLDDISADLSWCGLAGSPTKVHRVQAIVLTKKGYTEIPATEDGVRQLIRELVVDHTLG